MTGPRAVPQARLGASDGEARCDSRPLATAVIGPLAGGGLELLEHGLVVGTDPLGRDATLVIEDVDVG
jgi:hypothetical protein